MLRWKQINKYTYQYTNSSFHANHDLKTEDYPRLGSSWLFQFSQISKEKAAAFSVHHKDVIAVQKDKGATRKDKDVHNPTFSAALELFRAIKLKFTKKLPLYATLRELIALAIFFQGIRKITSKRNVWTE
jgi:hypothetical protein